MSTLRLLARCAAFAALAVLVPVVLAAQTPTAFQVKITGNGPAMILIPGLNSSGATWDSTVAHYQDHYTCYVLTLAGFAGTPPLPESEPLLSTVREQLAAFIKAHHLTRPILVGHSLGGSIALDLAEHHPSLIGPLVIVDSLPFYAGAWFQAKDLAAAQPTIAGIKAGMAHITPDQFEAMAKSGAATNSMTMSPAHQKLLQQWSAASDLGTYRKAFLELVSEDLRPGLGSVTSPTLVVGTWQGWVASLAKGGIHLTRADFVATFQQQYASLPHLHFAMADHSDHFAMWDNPAWFFHQLDDFIANPNAVVRDRGF